jgi:predicted amidohydrolase
MVKIAVIQPALALGKVDENLARVKQLILAAHTEYAPQVIVLPESLTSPNVYSPIALHTPQPLNGQFLNTLKKLAHKLDVVITAGFVAIRCEHTYGTYVMVEPDGTVHLHDKDIPTAWEQHYYKGGSDDGVVQCHTLGCKVGLMSGWEWARYRTAERIVNAGAQLVLGGMCWYSMPTNWYGVVGRWMCREHEIYKQQSRDLPSQVARLTGVPVAHAAHVGAIRSDTPLLKGIAWQTEMVGESQICDATGKVLARLSLEDGEGYIAADVVLNSPQPVDPILDRYWIPDMTPTSIAAWHLGNTHGALTYRIRHRFKRFPWQAQ